MAEIATIEQLRTLAGLRRVNRALSAWDELDAMQLLAPSPRPWVAVPALDREQLKSLQRELVAHLGALEARAGR